MRALRVESCFVALAASLRPLAWLIALAAMTASSRAADLPSLPASAPPMNSAQSPATNELSQAAACIERGDEIGATTILNRHLADHPEHVTIRAYLAELYFRRGEWLAAQGEFDRFVEEAQLAELELPRLIHGHTRLMAIAEKLGDRYSEHLHRGIGLFWLSRQAVESGPALAERFLCAAAGELARAERIHSDRARLHWYRYRVWQQLGQASAARSALRAAWREAAFSDLTLAEKLAVAVARDAELPPCR